MSFKTVQSERTPSSKDAISINSNSMIARVLMLHTSCKNRWHIVIHCWKRTTSARSREYLSMLRSSQTRVQYSKWIKTKRWNKKDLSDEDTEKVTLPPIQHEKTESDIIEVDLTLNPVHCSWTWKKKQICWKRKTWTRPVEISKMKHKNP